MVEIMKDGNDWNDNGDGSEDNSSDDDQKIMIDDDNW